MRPMASAAVVLAVVGLGQACSCAFSTFGATYCRAPLAIKATILGEKKTQGSFGNFGRFTEIEYLAEVDEEFRTSPDYETATSGLGRTATLLSSASSASCGVELTVGQTYLITGYVSAGRIRLTSCMLKRLWATEVTPKQRRRLRSGDLDAKCKAAGIGAKYRRRRQTRFGGNPAMNPGQMGGLGRV